MEITTMILVSIFSGFGLVAIGFYIGMNVSVGKYIEKFEEKEKEKAIKRRDAATFIPKMTDQEARESDENSVEKINQEVI